MKKFRYTISINHDGKEWSKTIEKVPFTIGRSDSADVVVSSDLISRQQIRVGRDEKGIWIEDLGSRNGTFLEDKDIKASIKTPYIEGQKIQIGLELGLSLKISAQEITQKEVIEFPKAWAKETPELKVSNGPSLPAKPKTQPKPVEAVDEEFLQGMNAVEKNLFAQIRKMVGNEAEEIRKSSLQKAKEIKEQAQAEKEKLLSDAKLEAALLIKSTNEQLNDRLKQLRIQKAELEKNIQELQVDENQRARKVDELTRSEENRRFELKRLEDSIRELEARMISDKEEADALRAKLLSDQEKFRSEYEDFKLDERKMRAQLETQVLEAKVKALEIQAETTKYKEQLEHLKPQLEDLKAEKAKFEEYCIQDKLKLQELELSLAASRVEHERLLGDLRKVKEDISKENLELERLEKEKLNRKEEAEVLISNTLEECRALKSGAHSEVEAIEQKKLEVLRSIEEESQARRQSHQEEFDSLLKEKAGLTLELGEKRKEAQDQCNKLVDEAREQCRLLMKEAQENGEKLREQFLADISDIRVQKEALEVELRDLERKRSESIEETKLTVAEILLKAEKDGELVLKAAEESASQILTKERFIFEEEQRKIRQETDMFIENAHRNAQEILARAETEAREFKIKQAQQIAELKQVEMFRIKELKAQGEEEILKRKHDHAKNVSANIYALIASEMYKAKDKVLDDTMIEEFTKGIKDLVVDTILDRVGPDDDKLQAILKTSADAKNKERVYWQRIKITAIACAFALMTFIAFPQLITYPRNMIVGAFTEKSDNGSDEFLNKVKEARIRAIYNPATTPEFKSTYVDNILFTTDFIAKQQAQGYQDQWILELNDYFIKSLDVKDTTIIKFVSLEAALVKDLVRMKDSVDPQNPDPKIQEMKSREQEFRGKLAEIFEDQEKVSRYYQFSEKFWNNYYNPRRPAAQE